MAVGETAAAPSHGHAREAPAAGKKRSAAEAELAELSDEEEAELSDDEEAWRVAAAAAAAAPARPRSGRAAAAGVPAVLAAVLTNDALDDAAPSRALPQRATAISSPAGKRRRLMGAIQAAQQAAGEAVATPQAAAPVAAQAEAAEQAAAAAQVQAAEQAAAAQAELAEEGRSNAAAAVRRSRWQVTAAVHPAADEEDAANTLCGMADGVQLVGDAEVARVEAEASTSAAALLGKSWLVACRAAG